MRPSTAERLERKALLAVAFSAVLGGAIVAAAMLWDSTHPRPGKPLVTVYKHPECGCCNKWIRHLESAGFAVEPRLERRQSDRQAALGVPAPLRACHTAIVDGYVVEGHVPADDIRRLLRERPKARGLAVPGMPIGSPGMEQGDRVDPYEVLLFDEAGSATTFARYGGPGT